MQQFLVWALLAAVYAFLFYLIFLLWRMKHAKLSEGKPFRSQDGRLFFRYPPWWSLEETPAATQFRSNEKDGVLSLQVREMDSEEVVLEQVIDDFSREAHISWDEGKYRPLEINGLRGVHLESRATVHENARFYYQIWAFAYETTLALFVYRSSVIFGMVDAHYLNELIKTVRMPAPSAGAEEA